MALDAPRSSEGLKRKEDHVSDIDGRTDMHFLIQILHRVWKKFRDYCTIMNLL